MFVFLFVCGSAKYIEKLQANRPSEIQRTSKLNTKIDQVAPIVLSNSKCALPIPLRSRLWRSPVFGPNLWMIFDRPLADTWRPLDTLSIPSGWLCEIEVFSSPDSTRFCQYLAQTGCSQTARKYCIHVVGHTYCFKFWFIYVYCCRPPFWNTFVYVMAELPQWSTFLLAVANFQLGIRLVRRELESSGTSYY